MILVYGAFEFSTIKKSFFFSIIFISLVTIPEHHKVDSSEVELQLDNISAVMQFCENVRSLSDIYSD
jgi:hypothetical protein